MSIVSSPALPSITPTESESRGAITSWPGDNFESWGLNCPQSTHTMQITINILSTANAMRPTPNARMGAVYILPSWEAGSENRS